jgi:poly(A) polymerase
MTNNEVKVLAKSFASAGYQLYEVGGSVRDSILKRPCTDIDMATDALPDATEGLLMASNLGAVYLLGKEYGTISLNTYSGNKIEVTTFRKEVYPSNSRKPVVTFGKYLSDDLARRDFTFNAMAHNPLTDAFLDGQV